MTTTRYSSRPRKHDPDRSNLTVVYLQVVELSGISADELVDKLWNYTDVALIDAYYDSLGLGESRLCMRPMAGDR